MTPQELLKIRLANQQILSSQFNTPDEIVRWLGAVQAQDYMGALWAVGCRLKNAKEKDIETAIAEKTIVRTWPMRGTLHFVAPEDAKWMLQLLTPRVISRAASVHRNSALDKKVFEKSKKIIIKALQGGKQLLRSDMYQVLEDAKINTSNTRGLHILGVLAQEGLICFGPRVSKQPSFVLLDEWITNHKLLKGDEAIAELTERYFTSHGPATIQDFCWWSGLTQTEARRGLEIIKQKLVEEKINGQSFWMKTTTPAKIKTPGIYLLPPFDEYLVAYKDRSAALESLHSRKVFSINGIFSPVVIINGKIAAIWKRTITKKEVIIELQAFQKFTPAQKESIRKAAKKYSRFIGLEQKLLF
jgi:hypothetical protein